MRRLLIALLAASTITAGQETQPERAPAAPAEQAHARIAEIEIRLEEAEDPHAPMPIGPKRLNYLAFMRFVKRAAQDSDLDAVILKPKSYELGMARLLEVREALGQLRSAGKKVFFYKENLSTADLVLASVADRISVPESGMVVLPGLATESWYMAEMLSKLRLRFDVLHIGAYKTAGESLVRNEMSKEMRETLDPLLDEFHASMVKAIAEGRGIAEEKVHQAIDQAILSPVEAQRLGLIDRVEYYDQFKEGIKAYFPERKLKWAKGYGRDKGTAIDPNNPMAVMSLLFASMFGGATEPDRPGPKIAIIYCTGMITSGKSQYDWQGNVASMGSETIVQAIEKAAKDESVKAIVLRVNSPGGSALASDMIWRALEQAKQSKPVIASMGDVAASGGYYISMNAHTIVAQPQTITGSIGVVGLFPYLDDLMAWVGIHPQRVTRGKHSATLMTTKGLDDEGKAMLRKVLERIYGDFVAKVAAGRGKTPAEIEPIARGRVWTGRAAQSNGLVDQLGGLEDAIALARARGGIPADAAEGEDFHVVEYPRRAGPFEMLEEMFGMRLGLDAVALRAMPELARVLRHLQSLQTVSQDRACMVMPELSGLTRPFAGVDR